MKILEINTDLLIADAIIEEIEYENDEYARLKEQKISCDGNYFWFDVIITNINYIRLDILEGDKCIGFYEELHDFDYEIVKYSFFMINRFRKKNKKRNIVLISNSDTVKEIVFNAI